MIDKPNLLEMLMSEELLSVLARRSLGTEGDGVERLREVRSRHEALSRQLLAERFVVPIAGVQGAGKSTLMNALLFRSPVLPVDVDETTCVPVEVRYSPSPTTEAVVRFMDGREQRVPATESDLQRFVHQANNPANRDKVERLLLESDAPILENGVVMVDLPGLGSLTRENVRTTQDYLAEAVGVVFLLRTVPPLTRTESIFLGGIWAKLGVAFFVQNQWVDESAQEVKDAKEHNISVLKEVAKVHRIENEGPPDVYVVNAYLASEGSLKANPELIDRSGMETFAAYFRDASAEWPTRVLESVVRTVGRDLVGTLEVVGCLKGDCAKASSTVEAEIAEEASRFERYIGDIKKRQGDSVTEVDSATDECHQFLGEWAIDSAAELRNRMRTKLRAGIADGPRLQRAFSDEQRVLLDDLYDFLQTKLLNLTDRLRTRYKDVPEWSEERWKNVRTSGIQEVSVEEKTKWESLLRPAGSVGGGLGGAYGGAKLGALAGSWAGPLGSIIGGIVGGLLGGLLGSWAGSRSQAYVIEKRADNVEPIVFAAIDTFIQDQERVAGEWLGEARDQWIQFLNGWIDEQTRVYEVERERRLAGLRMNAAERQHEQAALENDERALSGFLERLSGGVR
jgi:hypothetical protein